MTGTQALVKTLIFQLDNQSNNESLLYDATLESRSVYNETIRLAKEGVDWDSVPDCVADDADVSFRISAKPYKRVKGVLEGIDAHLDILKTALTSDEWEIGTAEALGICESWIRSAHVLADRSLESPDSTPS